ncbi:MAG: aminotransferase [Rhizobiales bacterium]|nr:aminotransferase [Hyphomicrobiales bacterium]
MNVRTNPAISAVEAPPIAEAMTWLRDGPRNRPVINLCQAVPSYPPAEAMQEAIGRFAREDATSLYTDILGLPALRESLSAHMSAAYGGRVASEDVAITAGCNQAFAASVMALAGQGDNVILSAPYYFNHQMWLDMLRVEVRHLPCRSPGLIPSPDDALDLIDARTRAIVLCSPNNPTGAIYSPATLAAFHEVARAKGTVLVLDETYKDFRTDPRPPHALFAANAWQDSFIQLYSFSKVFGMTGYRVGSLIAGPAILKEVEKILDCVAICAPHISQSAALFGLEHLDNWKAEKIAMIHARAAALRAAFARPDLSYRLESAGAFFAYVRHPFPGKPAKVVAQHLAGEHDLLCLPGSMFGPGQEDYLRLAFANVDATVMPQVAERLVESQATLNS